MEFTNIWLFASVSLILLLTPGPNIICVVTKGVTDGRRAGFKAALGASTGDIFQVLAASLGLGVLLKASYFAFFCIKVIGAGYLLYLGIRCLLNRKKLLLVDSGEGNSKSQHLFLTGFLTSALNPKTSLFFLSFLPQFIDSNSMYGTQQMLLLGAVFVIMGFIVLSICVLTSLRIRAWFMKSERIQAWFNWVTGLIFIGFGLRVAFSER